jgi:hypothetical protein
MLIPFALLLVAQTTQPPPVPPALAAAVQRHIAAEGAHELPVLRHALADLNGDGRDDAVVLLTGSDWCGSGGCTMLVFRGTPAGFAYVSGSTITYDPIRILPEKVRGWYTLVVYSKGRGDVLMRFDGTRYPLNPSRQPKASQAQVRAARVVLQ